jgi:hypothetical protein
LRIMRQACNPDGRLTFARPDCMGCGPVVLRRKMLLTLQEAPPKALLETAGLFFRRFRSDKTRSQPNV